MADMPKMQEHFSASAMDGRNADLSRPSMASEALGLLRGEMLDAFFGPRIR